MGKDARTGEPIRLTNEHGVPEAQARSYAREIEQFSGGKLGGVPNAPFKKTWHELALKRMLREAAERGYERLSWTPGEAQAARYDLSKHIEDITLHGIGDNLRLTATNHNNHRVIDNQHVTPQELPNIIGKEAAEKLLSQPEPNLTKNIYAARRLNNLDLRVGGEGMRGFYDQIIPKALEKIGKEWGVKVQRGELPVPPKRGVARGHNEPIFYIDIPSAMREAINSRGMPLFQSGLPVTFTPVEGDPFQQAGVMDTIRDNLNQSMERINQTRQNIRDVARPARRPDWYNPQPRQPGPRQIVDPDTRS